MNWEWKRDFHKNWQKILSHMLIEWSALGAWYIALEGDVVFWPVGIATAFAVHLIVFQMLDVLHEKHHHHEHVKQGHAHHRSEYIMYMCTSQPICNDCRNGRHYNLSGRRRCPCICHKGQQAD